MDANANPIPESGERNVYCPFYSNCLDLAVRYGWESWGCAECPHKLTRSSHTEYEYECNHTDTHFDLPADVFREII